MTTSFFKLLFLNILLLLLAPCLLRSQTIAEIFKMLPASCSPEINQKQRALLLKRGEYTIPGGSSQETVKYVLDSISKNYMQYEYIFTTGQRGFNSYEVKRFKKTNGEDFILFSNYGGMRASFFQNELKVFYLRNNKLIEDTQQKLLPQTLDIGEFLKRETPDSIRTEIEEGVSTSYSLGGKGLNQIEFSIFPEMPLDNYEPWIVGYTFIFTWTGKMFTKKMISGKQ